MTNERTLRHPNGGALKIGTEVHVSADSFCDERSEISGCSGVFSSSVSNCLVSNSTVFNSAMQSTVARSSTIADSACAGLLVFGAVLHKVTAASVALIEGPPLTLFGVVAENCELYGNWELKGNARIHEGVWHRKPRFLRITGDNQVDFGITECRPGFAMLGCWCKPIRELLHAGPRLGNRHGWTGEQIEAARRFYQELQDVPMEM